MTPLRVLAVAFVAAALTACGGGGPAAIPVSTGGAGAPTPPPAPPPTATPQQNHVVVRYDRNGDSHPDVVTLDADETPFRIVAVLEGTAGGDAVDMTDLYEGQAIDAAISEALANYLAESFEVASEKGLDVVDSAGNPVQVTVFE